MIERRFVRAAVLSTAALVLVTAGTAQSLYSDPAAQFKTVQQVLTGESPRLNTWTRPDVDDLGRDRLEPLGWWAPGTPLFAFPLMRAGFSPATTARVLAIAMLLAGAAGWACWFAHFELPPSVTMALAVLLPWTRVESNALFQYSSEILVFAVVPWVLVSVLAAARRDQPFAWATVGLFAGSLYVVKYSASFVTAGVALWLLWRAWRGRGPRIVALIAFAAAASVPIAALSVFNRQVGTSNLLAASLGGGFSWPLVIHAAGLSGLAAADLDSVVRWLVLHPTHGVTRDPLWVSAIGLPGGLLLMVLVWRSARDDDAATLAGAVLAATTAAILTVWTISTGVSVEARHVASAALCVLPLALAEGRRIWQSAPRARIALAGAGAAYVIVPMLYGPVSVIAKVRRFPDQFRASATGLYNPLLAERDVETVVARLEHDFHPQTDVWYITDPLSSLDLPGRVLMVHADFIALDELRKYRFQTRSRPLRIHVLLPPRFETNGKGAVIRASFPQAVAWERDAIPGSHYDRWLAELRPTDH